MKKISSVIFLSAILFFAGCTADTQEPASDDSSQLQGTITLSGAWALYPMVVRWAQEFQAIHPKVKIDIAAGGAGKGMADCLAGAVDLAMVSREIYPPEIEKGAWWISVTKDAVVATINQNNPVLSDLLAKGVTQENLARIWISEEVKKWGQFAGSDCADPVHIYTRSDACGAASTWAQYLDKKQEDLLGIGVYGDPGIAQAITKDHLGIGFNNINYVYDSKTKKQLPGLNVVPIDLNRNGQLDPDEDFYSDRDQIARAIAQDAYPSPPARLLHLVSQGKPKRTVVLQFLEWILTDGRQYIPESGYINLTDEKIRQEQNKLHAN